MDLFNEGKCEKESMSSELSLIHTIYKKGDKFTCKNYWGMLLLGIIYKILSSILVSRLRGYAEEEEDI